MDVQYTIEEYVHVLATPVRAIRLERALAGFVRPVSQGIPAKLVSKTGLLILSDGSRVQGMWIGTDGRFICQGAVAHQASPIDSRVAQLVVPVDNANSTPHPQEQPATPEL